MSLGAIGRKVIFGTRESGAVFQQATADGGGSEPGEINSVNLTPGAQTRSHSFPGASALGQIARGTLLALALTVGGGLVMTGPASAQTIECPTAVAQAPAPVEDHQDFGNPQDVKAIKAVVKHRIGEPDNVSVSHDWALSRAYGKEDDFVVLLHRTQGKWKIEHYDGGAFDAGMLKAFGVPQEDVPNLMKTYT